MPFLIAPARINGQRGFLFDLDEKLRCFYDDGLRHWVVVDERHLAPVVGIGEDNELTLRNYLYNGEPVWDGPEGAVFCSVSDGWMYNPEGLSEPYAEKDVDGETWIGDAWWKASGEPCAEEPEIECSPRGTLLNEEGEDAPEPPTLFWRWPRWELERTGFIRTPWGVYTGRDGAEEIAPRRTVGSQRYRDGENRSWVLSADRLSLAGPRGLVIRFVARDRLWVLGVKGIGMWFQTEDGPDRTKGMALEPWRHDDETGEDARDPEGETLKLTFQDFVATGETDRMYVAEVALWR